MCADDSIRCLLRLLAVAFLGSWAGNASGQTPSLWEQRDPRKAFLFQDLKARSIGDVLTVAINENTDVANSDRRDMSKQSSTSAEGGFGYSGSASSGSASATINADSQRDFSGDVNYSSDRQFVDRFSVTVIDVLPNGNLVIAGTRKVLVEGDEKRLTLSGIVRSEDVREDNSVRSSDISNLDITYFGSGTEQHFIKQGWLARKVNKLWPF
jgi:flagellar L-ring protein precursor FlgH